MMNKLFDLKFVIGVFFLILGIMLITYALFTSGAYVDAKKINLICGLIMGSFGLLMIFIPSKNIE